MTHYCLCSGTGNKMLTRGGEVSGVLLTEKRMIVQLMGTPQYVELGEGKQHRHYPDLDILYCDKCGVAIALEGGA